MSHISMKQYRDLPMARLHTRPAYKKIHHLVKIDITSRGDRAQPDETPNVDSTIVANQMFRSGQAMS